MKPDYANAPVTEPYARDLILEAHQRLLPSFPSGKELVFVEFYEIEGFALVSKDSAVFYHPELVKQVPFDTLCLMLSEVMHKHMMTVTPQLDVEDLVVPSGTTLH